MDLNGTFHDRAGAAQRVPAKRKKSYPNRQLRVHCPRCGGGTRFKYVYTMRISRQALTLVGYPLCPVHKCALVLDR